VTTRIGAKHPGQKRIGRAPVKAKARIAAWFKSSRSALARDWRRQEGRWALWPPMAMMGGAAFAMVAPVQIGAMRAGGAALLAFVLAWAMRYGPNHGFARWRGMLAGALVFVGAGALGVVALELRTATVAAPRLHASVGPSLIEGHVMATELGRTRPRLRILVAHIEGETQLPRFVELSTSEAGAHPAGRAVRCRAILAPPSGPMAPSSFNPARRAFFEKTGATGFTLGPCRPIQLAPPKGWWDRAHLKLAAVRRDLTETIYAAAPGEGGAVAAALITGDRSLMSSQATIAYSDSGLGHILSVSGLHMSLVAGAVYGTLHLLFACAPWLALRFPVRKWAAAAAIAASVAYLLLSGASVPAQRALVMSCVAMGAILVDRPALSMRGLALAAVIIVAWQPESVVDVGFQMSFAATAALVALFEMMDRRGGDHAGDRGALINLLSFSWRALGGMIAVSLVAGLATDPFAIYHFQRINIYGLSANLAASPFISFLIPFAALAAAFGALFGAAEAPLQVMAGALDVVGDIARLFAERPEAVRPMPAAPPAFLALSIAAIAWACLWRSAVRWLSLAGVGAALLAYATAAPIVLVADGDLRAVIVREGAQWRALAPSRSAAFARERMAQLAGIGPAQARDLPPPGGCAQGHCVWRTPRGGRLFDVSGPGGFTAACAPGAVVIARVPAPSDFLGTCKPKALLDPADRARYGGFVIREGRNGLTLERAAPFGATKPWSGPLTRSDE
jgi:competence protein ComEC